MSLELTAMRAVLLDMDGVLWRGSQVLPGTPEFFAFLQQVGVPFALATNNSSKTVAGYVERLNEIGVPVGPQQVITSAVATADYVSQHFPPGTPVYIIGQQGIREELAARGFHEDGARAGLVVVGIDFDVTYAKLKTAVFLIRAGAAFIGTNGDRTFPLPDGLAPGNGALLAAIQAATDVAPVVIGKPERAMFEVALQRLGTHPEQTLMVGDRLETDITGAQRVGLPAALVLTGTTTREQAMSASQPPDAVYEDLAALHAAWLDLVK